MWPPFDENYQGVQLDPEFKPPNTRPTPKAPLPDPPGIYHSCYLCGKHIQVIQPENMVRLVFYERYTMSFCAYCYYSHRQNDLKPY